LRAFFVTVFGALLSWWGLMIIAALDSSMIFFLPMAVDLAVVILTTQSTDLWWMYPVLAAAGSVCGGAVTFYVGSRLGEAGLKRFVSDKRMAAIRRQVESKGAVALAATSLVPPPFPFTASILAAGALQLNAFVFFVTFFLTRTMRYMAEALLAHFYGPRIIEWLRSETLEYIGIGLFAAAVIGSAATAVQLLRKTRGRRKGLRRKRAA
jgi:membrane protein YqaA with SNARE-associated domain